MADLRIAILDSDSGFVRVLVKRAGDLGWQHRRLEAPPLVEEFVAMRVNALVVDLALLGPGGWEFLERVSAALPGMGVVVCTGPHERLPARARPARRRRRLGHQAVPPGGGARARGGRGPPPQARVRPRGDAVRSWPASSRSAPISSRPSWAARSVDLTRREFEVLELLAQAQGKVLQREEIYQAVWGYAMAHGDRSVDVFVRKVRQKLEKASPDWSYIHTHFGVGYRFQPERPGGPDEAAAFEASLGQQAEVPAPPSRPEAEHGELEARAALA